MVEGMIEEEAMAEDEEDATVVDEVGVLTTTSIISTTIRREQKAQHEATEEAYNSRYDKSQFECYNFYKFDHYAKECRTPIRVKEKTNYAEQKTEERGTLRNTDDRGQENTWYLDTGTSNHMCGERSMFVELNESLSGNI